MRWVPQNGFDVKHFVVVDEEAHKIFSRFVVVDEETNEVFTSNIFLWDLAPTIFFQRNLSVVVGR